MRKDRAKVKKHRNINYWRERVPDRQVRNELIIMDDAITDLEDKCGKLSIAVILLGVAVLTIGIVGIVVWLCL